nr:calcium binding mitochondrial carrier protein [Hymenolepis microstoma]
MTDIKHQDTHPPTLSLPLPQTTIVAPTGVILCRKSVDRRRYLAGFTAGCVSRTLTAPIDRLKVLRQAAIPEIEGLNMYRSFRVIVAEGGFCSLWRGNGMNVLKNGPETALRFGFHGQFKELLFPNVKELHPLQRLYVASLAGACSLTFTYPMEVMKTRMALRKTGDPNSLIICMKALYNQGGLRSLYRGYAVSMLSYVPYAGLELSFYELFKRTYMEYFCGYKPGDPMPHLATPVAIGIIICSSFIPMLIVYPANLMRTRFQASTALKPPSIVSMFMGILRKDGLGGLYRGYLTSLTKTLPSVTISYLTFETVMELMGLPTLGSK